MIEKITGPALSKIMESTPPNSPNTLSFTQFIIATMVFLALAAFYYAKDREETYTGKHFNSVVREIPIIVLQNPENFKDDPVTYPDVMRSNRYIWVQKSLYTFLYELLGDFHTVRLYLLPVLVFLTALSTFFLFWSLTQSLSFSIIWAVLSILGYTTGVDDQYGFDGVMQTTSRYIFGIFAPLFLLFLINHVSSLNKLPILFFLIGLGVNLHPPNAINMALVFGVVLIWKNGFSKVHYKTASQCVILFLIGALPFVIHFGTPFFSVPSSVEDVAVTAKEFFDDGLYLFTYALFERPIWSLFEGILFPAFLSYVLLAVAGLTYIANREERKEEKTLQLEILRILCIGILISYALFIFNTIFFGGILPRLIGPHSLSLHRVSRVLFLFGQAMVVLWIWMIWNDPNIGKRNRKIIAGLLMLDVFLGFQWPLQVARSRFIFQSFSQDELYFISTGIFAVVGIWAVVNLVRNRNYPTNLLIRVVIILSLPNTACIADSFFKHFPVSRIGDIYSVKMSQKINSFNSLKGVVHWSKNNSAPTDRFMFFVNDPNKPEQFYSQYDQDASYFKTRAARHTYYVGLEVRHFNPLRKRKVQYNLMTQNINRLRDAFSQKGGIKEAARIFKQEGIEYLVTPKRIRLLQESFIAFESDEHVVYSIKAFLQSHELMAGS